jgi:hypothetical protein
MKFKNILPRLLAFVCLIGILPACDKMDSNYVDFVKNGEIVYAGKPNSVIAHGGINRMVLSLLFEAEPVISKVKVYWNFKADSAIFNVQKLPGKNIDLTFPTLAKGNYSFEIFTYDNAGNKSVRMDAIGQVYDSNDVSALAASVMPLKSANIIERTGVIEWYKTDYFSGIEVTYVNTLGQTKTVTSTSAASLKLTLDAAKPGSTYSYRTVYLPDANALDAAYSPVTNGTLPLYSQLDKTKFKEYGIPPAGIRLPGDYIVTPIISNGTSLDLKKAWDDKYGDDDSYLSGVAAPTALSFTVDLGVTTKLGAMRYFQRGINSSILEATYLYNAGNLRTWELWGRATEPNPDGSYTGWTKIGDMTYAKPSNAARGTNTDADRIAANAGHLITISAAAPAVRYIRLKPTANWTGTSISISILEMALYEQLY